MLNSQYQNNALFDDDFIIKYQNNHNNGLFDDHFTQKLECVETAEIWSRISILNQNKDKLVIMCAKLYNMQWYTQILKKIDIHYDLV